MDNVQGFTDDQLDLLFRVSYWVVCGHVSSFKLTYTDFVKNEFIFSEKNKEGESIKVKIINDNIMQIKRYSGYGGESGAGILNVIPFYLTIDGYQEPIIVRSDLNRYFDNSFKLAFRYEQGIDSIKRYKKICETRPLNYLDIINDVKCTDFKGTNPPIECFLSIERDLFLCINKLNKAFSIGGETPFEFTFFCEDRSDNDKALIIDFFINNNQLLTLKNLVINNVIDRSTFYSVDTRLASILDECVLIDEFGGDNKNDHLEELSSEFGNLISSKLNDCFNSSELIKNFIEYYFESSKRNIEKELDEVVRQLIMSDHINDYTSKAKLIVSNYINNIS